MKKTQAVMVAIVALAVGYVAGYFSHLVRFPLRHQHPELFTPSALATPVVVHPIAAEVEKARKLRSAGKLAEAQTLLRDQLHLYPQAPETRAARELLGGINTELFFSRDDLFGKQEYVVARGDSLARIAGRLNSSPEMIMRANDLGSTEEGGVEPGAVEIAEEEKPASAGPAATPAPNPDVPPHGIALLKDDLAELQLLLSRGTPVTIVRSQK